MKRSHLPLALGLPFRPSVIAADYLSWPPLPELFPVSFPGVKTSRDEVVVDVNREQLLDRMTKYFDPKHSAQKLRAFMPTAVTDATRFDARKTRQYLIRRGFKPEFILPYT